jgi:uncharacterized protein YerC
MTQVSKVPLRKEIETRVFEIFLSSFAKANKKEEIDHYLQDLLSPTERIMLAKRISIAFLLDKGYDQRTVSRILKVSLTTVNRVSLRVQLGGDGFRKVIKAIALDEKKNNFWQKLDELIDDVVPQKGKNWSSSRKEQWVRKIKRKKAV